MIFSTHRFELTEPVLEVELFLKMLSLTDQQKVERKEGNVLFNDTLNTFYLRLYDVRHMVKDHSDSER